MDKKEGKKEGPSMGYCKEATYQTAESSVERMSGKIMNHPTFLLHILLEKNFLVSFASKVWPYSFRSHHLPLDSSSPVYFHYGSTYIFPFGLHFYPGKGGTTFL
jgi:hypothetical protein